MANGQIERRKSARTGKVSWRVRWTDATGKRSSRSFDRRADAKEFLARQHGQIADAKIGRPQRPTAADEPFAVVAEAWLKDRPAHLQRVDGSRLRNHLVPFLSDFTVEAVATDVQLHTRLLRHLEAKDNNHVGRLRKKGRKAKRGLAPQTILNAIRVLTKLLADVGYPGVRIAYKVPEKPHEWIQDPASIPLFLEACPDWFRPAAALAVYAGLRAGEVAGLQRADLDWGRKLIHIRRSFDGPVKNYQLRSVALPDELASILRPALLRHSNKHVVVAPDGKPITREYRGLSQQARRTSKRAASDSVNFHGLRHTYASHLAVRGIPLATISKLLGHKSLTVTQRYAHLHPTENIARDPRVHLSFGEAPAGDVVQLDKAAR